MIHKVSLEKSTFSRLLYVPALLLWLIVPVACNSVSAQQNPDSSLYHSGEDATAILLNGKARVPGNRFPCANCHGDDGMGRREGATEMPPVSWGYLSQSTPDRPAYTIETFKNAVTQGVSANGRKLGELMPRYETDSQNLDKLIEYLNKLDSDQRTGIATRTILIVPPESIEIRVGFSEAIQRFNEEGGSYGRTVTLGSGSNHFLEADNIASIIDEQLGQAIQKQILDSMVEDGIARTALLNGPPDPELSHKLSIAGIQYDELAPTMLVTDRLNIDNTNIESWLEQMNRVGDMAKPSSEVPLKIYAPVSAVAPLLESISTKLHEFVLVDLDESSVRWALSNNQSARAAVGFALGMLLGEALLLTGRNPTRNAVIESMKAIDLQERLFTWRSGSKWRN